MQQCFHPMPTQLAASGYRDLSPISETESFLLYRALAPDGQPDLIIVPTSAGPAAPVLHQLEHEVKAADEIGPDFVVWPLRIERPAGRTALILEDCPFLPITELLRATLQAKTCLRVAARIAAALAEVDGRELVHRDIRPENTIATAGGGARLTGFRWDGSGRYVGADSAPARRRGDFPTLADSGQRG